MKPIIIINRSPHDPFVVKNVYENLKDVAEMASVSLFDSAHWASKKNAMLKHVGDIIKAYTSEQTPLYIDPKDWSFLKDYKVAVYNSGLDPSLKGDCKLVRIPYGQAKSHALMSAVNKWYDLILSPGPFWTKAMLDYPGLKVVETGYPKFDDWFTPGLVKPVWYDFKDFPVGKKILYFSTWGDLSTCQHVLPQMTELAKNGYRVLLKPHDGTYYQEEWKWRPYIKAGIPVIGGEVGIQSLFKSADYVITDISGTMFTSYLCDKKTILIDHPFKNGIGTVDWSTDQVFRDRFPRVKSDAPWTEFRDAIEGYDDDLWYKKRHEIRGTFFSGADGKAGERCAEEIRKLL